MLSTLVIYASENVMCVCVGAKAFAVSVQMLVVECLSKSLAHSRRPETLFQVSATTALCKHAMSWEAERCPTN